MDTITDIWSYVWPFLVILTVIVFAHELGHYLLHEWSDLHVDRSMISLRSQQSSAGEDAEEYVSEGYEWVSPAAPFFTSAGGLQFLTTESGIFEVGTTGPVVLAVRSILAGADQEDADRAGRETLAASIRDCDGRHFQLLSEDEEEALTQKLPSRGGLLTPLWRLRTLTVGPATPAGG